MSTGLIIGAAGAIAGGIIAGPVGAQWGFLAGQAIGSIMDPIKTEGPRSTDLKAQGSQYGSMIPLLYGKGRMAGQIMWAADKVEHAHTSGGKGGPQQTTFSYSQSFAVNLHEGPDGHVDQVLANGRLVWDESTGLADIDFVQYPGSESQLPDPTMEAVLGVGEVSGNRGNCYVVFTDMDLTPFGQMIPNLTFICSKNAPVEGPIRALLEVDDEPVHFPIFVADLGGGHWESQNAPAIMAFPRGSDDEVRILGRQTNLIYRYSSTDLAYIGTSAPGPNESYPAANDRGRPLGNYVYGNGDTTPLWAIGANPRTNDAGNVNPMISSTAYEFSGGNWNGTNWGVPAGLPLGYKFKGAALSQNGRILLVILDPSPPSGPQSGFVWYKIIDGAVDSHGTAPSFTYLASGYSVIDVGEDWALSLENNGRWLWAFTANVQVVQLFYIDDDGVLSFNTLGGSFVPYPVATIVAGCIAALPQEGYAAVAYDNTVALLTRFTATTHVTTYGDIVADQSRRVGLVDAQFNVAGIQDPITGLLIANQMPARSVIEALQPYDYFDAVESDATAKFVKRGGASVATIDDDDLGAFPSGSEPIAQVALTRMLEQALPARVDVVFLNEDSDYQEGTQGTARVVGDAVSPISLNTAIAMTNVRAKQVADVNIFTAWYGRDKGKTALPPPYLTLEPTDVITVQEKTYRIDSAHESMQGPKEVDLTADLAALYFQQSTPAPGSGFIPQDPPDPQGTELAILDIPYIRDVSRQAVLAVAMQGAVRPSWPGAALFKSIDGGTNYSQITTDSNHDTIGEALTLLPNYGGVSFDEGSVLQLKIHPGGGGLVSATRDEVFGGANLAMVGAEMIAYKNATLVSADDTGTIYNISGMRRGINNTAWAMRGHAIGDLFCTLPTSLTLDAIGADYGITRQYKPVTFGQVLGDVDPYDFRSNGISVAPYAPVYPAIGFIVGGDLLMEWNRCSRISPGWLNFRAPTGEGPPLGEAVEQYRVQIWADGTYQTVLNSYIVTAGVDFAIGAKPQFVYTTAMQTTDFGAPVTVPVAFTAAPRGVLGWGYDTLGRLPLFSPSDVPGYVPPNPPPADAIRSTLPYVEVATVYSGTFDPNVFWIVQVTIGSTPTTTIPVLINAAEYLGPPSPRIWTLSRVAGDFGPQANAGAWSQGGSSNSVLAQFWIGAGGSPTDFLPTFPTGTVIYLNIRNAATGYPDVPMFATIKNLP